MSDRIRGQEVQVRITKDGVLQKELDEVRSFDFTYKVQIQTEAFLGRTSDEKDEIFKGIAGSLEFLPRSAQGFELLETIRERAQRRVKESDSVINIQFVANFPNGDRPRLTILDAKFQDPGGKVQGREQFVNVPLSFEASSAKYSAA